VGEPDLWQLAEIGVAYVANEADYAERVLDRALRYVEESRPDLEILDVGRDATSFFS
jgi:uncharacterized protein YlxP (DUF503 family)